MLLSLDEPAIERLQLHEKMEESAVRVIANQALNRLVRKYEQRAAARKHTPPEADKSPVHKRNREKKCSLAWRYEKGVGVTSLSEAATSCAKFRDGDEDGEMIGASEYYDHQTGRVFTDARTGDRPDPLQRKDRDPVTESRGIRDISSNGVPFDWTVGGPWDIEAVCILYKSAAVTEQQLEDAMHEISKHVDVYEFRIVRTNDARSG